jgi:hypothetical protein
VRERRGRFSEREREGDRLSGCVERERGRGRERACVAEKHLEKAFPSQT